MNRKKWLVILIEILYFYLSFLLLYAFFYPLQFINYFQGFFTSIIYYPLDLIKLAMGRSDSTIEIHLALLHAINFSMAIIMKLKTLETKRFMNIWFSLNILVSSIFLLISFIIILFGGYYNLLVINY